MLTNASYNDLNELDELAIIVIKDMEISHIPQWSVGYPARTHFEKDVEDKAIYIYKDKGVILGSISVLPENDPAYKTINTWIKEKSIVIHRMLVHPNARNKGIAKKLLDKAVEVGKIGNYESIKIDTHIKNYKMRSFLIKNGFIQLEYLGIIDRLAFEKVLEE